MQQPREGVVLVDMSAGEGRRFDQSFLEKVGHDVLVCEGPHESRLCPLLAGTDCRKFNDAHGIVFSLDLDRAQHRAILAEYQERAREGMPIRAVVTPDQAIQFADLLNGVEVWTHEPTVADLDGFASEVEAADRFES